MVVICHNTIIIGTSRYYLGYLHTGDTKSAGSEKKKLL